METTKTPINESEHVDYLFHRMFAIVRLLLSKSGRGGYEELREPAPSQGY
jgi:hypothetical protein